MLELQSSSSKGLSRACIAEHEKCGRARNRDGVKIIRPLPNEAGASLPPPYVVQKAIKQEQQAFQDCTARWQQSLRDLQQIDQVFII
jgi:hypothetical protein